MVLGPRLDLRQTQSLVMTPQLQQAIKLLALSNLEIESFVGQAIEANPLLEAGEAQAAADPVEGEENLRRTSLESSPVDQLLGEGRGAEDRPLDIDDIAVAGDRDTGDGATAAPSPAGDWGGDLRTAASGSEGPVIDDRPMAAGSLCQHLLGQVGAIAYTDREAAIACHIIGLLDDAGYLGTDLRVIASEVGATFDEVEDALILVQSLDPTGVGARSLGECIALQAREANRYDPAMARLLDNLDLVARGERARLKRICGVDDEDFADMLAELRSYDPRPGLRLAGSAEDAAGLAVTPDIIVRGRDDGGWDLAINQASLPRLVVNRSYYLELRAGCTDKQARGWLSERLADANWLIKALDQRQKTILKVAAEIVKQQDGFFRHGVARLRPLTLKTVAEAIEMHESTVSRVTSNKFLTCPRGTYELKFFFTSGVAATDGDGAVSAEAVKASIRRLIDAETAGSILSDDALVDRLQEEGFDLARRTVAKYREAIGIGSSVQRRRQMALRGAR